MWQVIYTEIKYIIKAALTSYRTSFAGAILIIGAVYVVVHRNDSVMGLMLFSAGCAAIAGQDFLKKN